jgi:hypothetical protein
MIMKVQPLTREQRPACMIVSKIRPETGRIRLTIMGSQLRPPGLARRVVR